MVSEKNVEIYAYQGKMLGYPKYLIISALDGG